jgi:hypothetical protein
MLVQPVTMCTLNAVTDGAERGGSTPAAAAVMKTSVDALSDSLFRREDAPRDHATLMDLVFEQVTKEVLTRSACGNATAFVQLVYLRVHDISMIELELVFMPCAAHRRQRKAHEPAPEGVVGVPRLGNKAQPRIAAH